LSEILQQLEEFRKRLIDLTTRNSLLKANLTSKTQVLRFVDELPDQVFDFMLGDSNTMYLDSVSKPSELGFYIDEGIISEEDTLEDVEEYLDELEEEEREAIKKKLAEYLDRTALKHAESLGINTSYELPIEDSNTEAKDKHQDNRLQTLYYDDDLDLLASKIRRYANTTLQEKGINSLFLSFGYLEWIDPKMPDKKHLAPLLSIPVGIFRESKKEVLSRRGRKSESEEVARRLYRIEHSGEEVLTNEALKLKLDTFGIFLPEYDSELTPEEYFLLIDQDILSQNTEWKIHRYISLSKLDFSGSVLYQDLDVNKWLGEGLENHPLMKQLFGDDRDPPESVVDIELDNEPDLDFVAPIVVGADSSQHSAIVDALKGKNMVIEGPPGTGKSQTIVNLISALLYNNKKVLFVAEKAAALGVVKDRMAEIDLAPFCLDLQNQATSNKQQVIKDLESRLDAAFSMPREVEQKRNELNSLRKELADYTNSINSECVNNETNQEILAKVVNLKFKLRLADVPLKVLSELKVDEVDLNNFAHKRSLTAYFDSIKIIEDSSFTVDSHPWNFINNSSLIIADKDQIIENLESIIKKLKSLDDSLNELTQLEDYNSVISSLDNLLPMQRIGDYFGVDEYDYHTVSSIIREDKSKNYNKLLAESKGIITPLINDSYYKDLNKSIEEFDSKFDIELSHVANSIKEIETFSSNLYEYTSQFNSFFNQSGIKLSLKNKEDTIYAKPLSEIINSMPLQYQDLKDVAFIKDPTKTLKLLSDLGSDLSRYKVLSKPFEGIFDLTELPSIDELIKIKTAFIEKNMFSFLSSKWRKAKKQLMYFSLGTMPSVDDVVKNLNNLISVLKKAETIFTNKNYKQHLGVAFDNENTNIIGIKDLVSWYQLINSLNDKYDLNLEDSMEDLFMIDSSSVEVFNQGKFINKAAEIEHQLNIILKNKSNISDDVFLNNLLEKKDEIIQKSNQIFSDQEKIINSIKLANRLDKDEGFGANLLKLVFNSKSLDWSNFDSKFKFSVDRIVEFKKGYDKLIRLTDEVEIKEKNGIVKDSISAFEEALDQTESFKSWIDYLRNRQRIVDDENLNSSRLIAEKYDNCTEDVVLAIHEYRIYSNFARGILNINNIASFDEPRHKGAIKSFKEIDDELIKLNSKMIASKLSQNSISPGRNANKVKEKTNLALIKHLISKPKARVTVRDLITRASEALIEMSPCVMASPTTVAQYFKKEANLFDVVIIDEASQIKPQDCISTIARCKQSIIVGDPQQMPPSTWMQASLESESYDTGDETDAEDASSILDLAITAFPVQRMLKWHYRSQHESLIAFSNVNWYRGNLVFFPSAINKSRDLGVRYQFVPDAVNNDSNRNKEEANKVVEYVIEHMRSSKNKDSIGVIAMNINQQVLIEETLEKRLDEIDDNKVAAYIEHFAPKEKDKHRYFVKNLENVQGDERDVIVISITYAPKEKNGKLPQNFMQLRGEGFKRLNVLLTRAKKKMMVFSSFKYGQIKGGPGKPEGVNALRGFLEYAETGSLPKQYVHTGRDADSDFEVDVRDGLRRKGYVAEPQIGVSSYRIDLGVHHPDYPGEFIMGVECDGATYHSSKSARDRDKLRESVLVSLGWRIERIWSTTWFENPQKEIDRITNLIEEAREEDRKKRQPYKEPEDIFDYSISKENLELDADIEEDEMSQLSEAERIKAYYRYRDMVPLLKERIVLGQVTTKSEREIVKMFSKDEDKTLEELQLKAFEDLTMIGKEQRYLNTNEIKQILPKGTSDETIESLINSLKELQIKIIQDSQPDSSEDGHSEPENEDEADQKEPIVDEDVVDIVDDTPSDEKIEKQLIELREYAETDFPDTEPERRLLTDERIKLLIAYKPTTFQEYRSLIPYKYRDTIQGEEASQFLPEVFNIILSA
jgi:superfamily I DNA and/or RNA helicase/very-short-patch-repair endonuclease